MPRRTRPLLPLAALVPAALLLAGCGAHGQPAAMEACKSYTDATTGLMSPAQRDAALADAERWAGKAVGKAPQWQTLLDSIRAYHAAADAAPSASRSQRMRRAAATIEGSCELAARGY